MARSFTITQDGESRTFTVATGVGPIGPNEVNTTTETDITGLLKGDGANVSAAVAKTDYQDVPEVKAASFTAEVNGRYTATATLTVTDPTTPVQGKGFEVLVRNGTATVGGTAYDSAGTLIKRIYHSGAYANHVFKDIGDIELVDIDITGGTDIGAALADGDEFPVYDLSGTANRKSAMSRVTTYIQSGASTAGNGVADAGKLAKFGDDGEFTSLLCVGDEGNYGVRGEASSSGSGVVGAASATGDGGAFTSASGTGLRAYSTSGTYHAILGSSGDDRSFVARVSGLIGWFRGIYKQTIGAPTLTDDRAILFPDASGNVALTAQTDGTIRGTDLDFANTADIGAALADADEVFVSDGGGNTTRRKSALSRFKTYIQGLTDTLYVALTGNQTVAGVKTFSDNAIFSGDLTVDTSTLKVDSTNNWCGFGTATPATKVHVYGAGNDTFTRYQNTNAPGHTLDMGANLTGTNFMYGYGAYPIVFGTNGADRMTIEAGGAVSIAGDLTVDTSTLKVDSAGNRVIVKGTSSTYDFDVQGTTNSLTSKFRNAAGKTYVLVQGGATNSGAEKLFRISDTSDFELFSMRADGIGSAYTIGTDQDLLISQSAANATYPQGLNLRTNSSVLWGAGEWYDAKDVSLSRTSSGTIGVGTGAQGETDGTLKLGSIQFPANSGTWDGATIAGAQTFSGTATFNSDILADKTITAAATTGAQTINKNAGSVNFAAAATSLVVTNSRVTTSSVIICTIGTNDATMTSVQAVAASGSFTIYANVAATAETRVNFLVIN